MRKKIMLIVPMLHQGGFERVCVATARLLDPFYEVYIVVFDSADIAYDIKGLDVIDLHMGVKNGVVSKSLNVLRRSLAVRGLKKKLKIDLSYSFGPSANMVNVFSKLGEKVWVGIRSYMDMANESKIRLFCRRSDKVICCSKAIEEEIVKKYNCKKAITLYNPLDVADILRKAESELPRLPWDNTEHIIVSMGREDDVKGFWHLLKSTALVREEVPDAKLMIIGEGDFEEYRQLAKQLGMAEHIFFTGMKKNPFPYLKEAQVYVLSSYNEGFPNALLEAMAFGIPVIATDCKTGPREIVLNLSSDNGIQSIDDSIEVTVHGEYGVLVPNMSPIKNMSPHEISEEEEVLASEIIRMMTDKNIYDKYAEASRRRAEQFSNEAYVETLQRQINGV